jgi:hypothetical protein
LKNSPNTVALTPTHYFRDHTDCRKRNRSGDRTQGDWLRPTESKILHPEVFRWLRENVGLELNEVWDVDRYYYPGEDLPVLPRGARGEWLAAGRVCLADHVSGEYSHNRSQDSIYFPEVKHAKAFRERFGLWEENWALLNHAMDRRYAVMDFFLGDMARRPIYAVATATRILARDDRYESATFRHHVDYYKTIVALRDEAEEVLFRIEHPDFVIVTAREVQAASA